MLVDIDKLPKEGLRVSREFEFLSVDLVEENAVFLEPVHAEMIVKNVGEEISIKGRMKVRLSFVCSRCLMPYEFPVDSTFDLVYLPEELDLMKESLEEEDTVSMFYHNSQLDLREVILEQLNLTFPLKPLCSENCEGICAVCGQLRKRSHCACSIKEPDPRLQKLKILIRDKR